MFGVCVSTGHLLIYLPGPAAWLTSDMPAAVNYVNHNFLHHLLPTVPAIQMARFRRWLRVEAQHNAAAVLKVVDATVPKCMVSVSHAGGDPYHDY
jgi:hypothetical protein